MIVCDSCGGKIELFKVKDDVWAQAGLSPTATACLACVEKGLGHPVRREDIDMNFPWWKADRPEYYWGIRDGLEKQRPSSTEGLYKLGYDLGSRIAANSV